MPFFLAPQVAAHRSRFYRDFASGPFYRFNRPGVEPSEAIIEYWWRKGMMGGATARYDGIVAFSSCQGPPEGDAAGALRKYGLRAGEVDLLVATDAEAILPIGDWGWTGFAISVGNLGVYTAAAGIDPDLVIAVSLDVGTEWFGRVDRDRDAHPDP